MNKIAISITDNSYCRLWENMQEKQWNSYLKLINTCIDLFETNFLIGVSELSSRIPYLVRKSLGRTQLSLHSVWSAAVARELPERRVCSSDCKWSWAVSQWKWIPHLNNLRTIPIKMEPELTRWSWSQHGGQQVTWPHAGGCSDGRGVGRVGGVEKNQPALL